MAWVTPDPQIRKAEAPTGWFPLPPAQGTAGLKFLSPPVTPARLILSPATSKAQKCKSQHNSQMLLWHFHHPQPHWREEREGGRGGTHAQSVSGTGKAEQGGKLKCNAFSGILAAWGCSRLPQQPAGIWCKLVLRQPSCRGRGWTQKLPHSLLGQPVHPSRLAQSPRQCLPQKFKIPQNSATPIIIILLRGSSKCTKSQQGCAQFCRHAFFSLSKSFLSAKV